MKAPQFSALERGAVALVTTAFLALSGSAEPVGFVAGVEGHVETLRAGQLSWQAAQIDQDIEIGDTVRTGLDSAIKVVLVDDTTLSLGEDTELVIDSFVVGADATREPSILRQLKGQIRTRVGEAFGGTTRVEMHTPTAIMCVKGTAFTSRVGREKGEAVTLGCNWEGGVFMQLIGMRGSKSDIPQDFCRQAFVDRIEAVIPVPSNFRPVKQPAPQSMKGTVQAMLFGSGDSPGVADWLVEPPPVAAGPGGNPISIPPGLEPVIEGPVDAAQIDPPSTPPPPFIFEGPPLDAPLEPFVFEGPSIDAPRQP